MSFSTNVDLGQAIITGLIAVIGFLIKWELNRFNHRLDSHDNLIMRLMETVATLSGRYEINSNSQRQLRR